MDKWNMVKLSDVFTLQMGKTPSRNNPDYWNGNHKWLSIADFGMNGKYINKTKECITDAAVAESGIKATPHNTVVMSFKLSIGKTAITVENIFTNEAIMSFIDKGTYPIDVNYIYHLFSGKDWSKGTNKAVMGTTLNKATLSQITIPLPPIESQYQIADNLEKVSKLIDICNTILNKLDILVKSRFVEMFGDVVYNSKQWEIYTFLEIATSRLGKMLDSKKQTGNYSFPYLANYNVQWFRFELDNLNKMDFNEKDQIEFALEEGDLLVCEGGEIGRCAIWHNEVSPCFFQKALHRVRCKKDIIIPDYIIPDYLAWWFRFNCDNNGFSEIEGAKATIAHLPGAKLKKLNVVVPPLDLQKQFADFVAQTDKSKLAVKQILEKAETLKKSLMQEYFG